MSQTWSGAGSSRRRDRETPPLAESATFAPAALSALARRRAPPPFALSRPRRGGDESKGFVPLRLPALSSARLKSRAALLHAWGWPLARSARDERHPIHGVADGSSFRPHRAVGLDVEHDDLDRELGVNGVDQVHNPLVFQALSEQIDGAIAEDDVVFENVAKVLDKG